VPEKIGINSALAKQFGVTIPPEILDRAAKVVEK